MKTIIATNKAPSAIGPYNQAVAFENLIFTSGQIALDPKTMNVVEGGIKEQTIRVLENLKAVLEEADSSFDNIIKTTCFLASMDDFNEFNATYDRYFNPATAPARSTVAVKTLPKNVLVEVEVIAFKN